MDEKVYQVGGRRFALRPLTLRQKRDGYQVESALRAVHVKLAEMNGKDVPLSSVLALSQEADAVILSRDFPRWLATILTPLDQTESTDRDELANLMEEIDEQTQAEVLQDFFARSLSLISAPTVFLNLFSNETERSTSSSMRSSETGPPPTASPGT